VLAYMARWYAALTPEQRRQVQKRGREEAARVALQAAAYRRLTGVRVPRKGPRSRSEISRDSAHRIRLQAAAYRALVDPSPRP
jgi:hypothetical protein